MSSPPTLRHDFDRAVWRSVYLENEYGLSDDVTGACVLDVGANVGAFARLAAERGACVTAFEPDAGNLEVLSANVRHLLSSRVVVVPYAVLAEAGKARLYKGDDPAGYTLFGPHGAGEEVAAWSFDRAVKKALSYWLRGAIDVCKIDAEGAEYEIVERANLSAVRELLIEFHANYVPAAEARADRCRERLAALGFRELSWAATHEGAGWYRLYHGRREP